jgi:glyoxylase-like metal-dependent hydrolase (beta-lactamase superfamily II)
LSAIEPLRSGRFGAVEIIPGQWSEEWRMFRSCTLVVSAGGQQAIVDPAADEGRLAQLVPSTTLCINSHPHADHILFNPMFLHVPLYAPALDAHFYDPHDLGELGPDAESLIGSHVTRRASRLVRPPDRLLAHAEQLSIGGLEVRAVGIPGHTPGMLCLHFPAERLAYIADYDLTDFGPWYGNRSSDPDAFLESADRIRALDVDWIVTSHEVGIVRRDALDPLLDRFLAHIERRDERVLDRLSADPRNLDELDGGGVVYTPRAVSRSPWTRLWERQHVRKHLERLARRGTVSRMADGRWQRN